MNRGFGGPLLCVGDLLRDVADDATVVEYGDGEIDFTSSTLGGGLPPQRPLQPSCDLRQVFEDNYDQLVQSLEGNDHSWTTLTLKLCTALKTADKLVGSANSNIDSLLEKVASLETIIDRGDSVIAKVKSIQDDKLHKAQLETMMQRGDSAIAKVEPRHNVKLHEDPAEKLGICVTKIPHFLSALMMVHTDRFGRWIG